MASGMAEVFLRGAGQLSKDERARLEEQLQRVYRQGREAWPTVKLDATMFAGHLADVLSRPENAGQTLEQLHTTDLYLACACAAGDTGAIDVFHAQFQGEINQALGRQNVPAAMAEDLRQTLREWLFVAGRGEQPKIATYSGRGRLGGWARVVVVRLALKAFRGQRRLRHLDDEELELLSEQVADLDPEQQLMRVLYQSEFKAAFQRAVESLTLEERDLLQRHFAGGESIDKLGALLQVHRSTAARRLERAKQSLVFAIRREMMQQGLRPSTCESVMRLVRSQLDLSVRLILEE